MEAKIGQPGIAARRAVAGRARRVGGNARNMEISQRPVGIRLEPARMPRLAGDRHAAFGNILEKGGCGPGVLGK